MRGTLTELVIVSFNLVAANMRRIQWRWATPAFATTVPVPAQEELGWAIWNDEGENEALVFLFSVLRLL